LDAGLQSPLLTRPRQPVFREVRIENFRCIQAAAIDLHPHLNVLTGGNAAGKTSILEAIFMLGRARSFRTAEQRALIRSGTPKATIRGLVAPSGLDRRLAVEIAAGGVQVTVEGQPASRVGDLARSLAVEALGAGVQDLVQGSPELRRRALDWGMFHVEQLYLRIWRRFRQALAQRNAGLRQASNAMEMAVWDHECAEAAMALDALRLAYLERLTPLFRKVAAGLLQADCELSYLSGWPVGRELLDVLRAGRETDTALGYTRSGPHRADLTFQIDGAAMRGRSSRGQQKLLAAALVIAQVQLASEARGEPVALLVDEPDGDLDTEHAARLMDVLLESQTQLVLASMVPPGALKTCMGAMFHVEHGAVRALL
jgi:DNA replication and repair protein RecF